MKSQSTYGYTVAGLAIRSEIVLPELIPLDEAHEKPDVIIRLAPVPTSLPGARQPSVEAEIADNDILLRIPGVARYLIRAGHEILIEAEPEVHARDLRLFLLGSALGAIYFQRGFFPLHASVVVMNGRAVAFTGDSGAGKSTIAAWLNVQGYPLLCDDVCVIRFAEADRPIAYSGFPRMKLWRDALEAFAIDASGLQRDFFRTEKYHMPVSNRFWTDPVPLSHINILQFSDSDSEPRIEMIQPARAVSLLRDNTYRYQYISGLGLTGAHFLDCVRLARSAGVHCLTRPRQYAALAECQRLVERQMQ